MKPMPPKVCIGGIGAKLHGARGIVFQHADLRYQIAALLFGIAEAPRPYLPARCPRGAQLCRHIDQLVRYDLVVDQALAEGATLLCPGQGVFVTNLRETIGGACEIEAFQVEVTHDRAKTLPLCTDPSC